MAKIWQLSISYRDCAYEVQLNGIPIDGGDTADEGFGSLPLNPFLRAGENDLRVRVTRRGPDAEWSGRVEALAAGDIVDSGDPGEFELPAGVAPLEFGHRFESEVDLLSGLLERAQPAAAEDIRAFAAELGATLKAGDVERAMPAVTPKFEALAEAFGHPREAVLTQIRSMLGEFGPQLDFGAEDVHPRACCDGRLWVLEDAAGRPLLRVEDGDGGVTTIQAIAAILPEGPAIVL